MAWIFTMKVVLLLSGVLLMAFAMRVSVPLALEFMVAHVPVVWSFVLAWLRPPYLYVVINGIIISIAASSRFHRHDHDREKLSATTSISEDHHDHRLSYGDDDDDDDHHHQEIEVISPELEQTVEEFGTDADDDHVKTVVSENYRSVEAKDRDYDDHDLDLDQDEDQYELVMEVKSTRSERPPKRMIPELEEKKVLLSTEKPLVSAGFGDRKPGKPSPEGGKAVKVKSKPQRHETMEDTWKAIMEGRSMSSYGNMKRWDHSDFENQGRQIVGFGDLDQLDQHQARSPMMMKKSETFKDRTNQQRPAVGTALSPASATCRLRKEPSVSLDELNRRVEAFIKKFNEQMRLQRQESLNQYLEMINRGSH